MVAAFSGTQARLRKTTISIVVAVSVCHLLNDIMQSLLTSLYPMFRENYALDFVQIGLLTMTFQITASLLQPVVGIVTDKVAHAVFPAGRHGQYLSGASPTRLCRQLPNIANCCQPHRFWIRGVPS